MKMYVFRLMKFVPRGPVNNILALVQMMAWRQPGAKPLSEPMMSPCGCGDLSVRLGSRISPHRNRVVVEVH